MASPEKQASANGALDFEHAVAGRSMLQAAQATTDSDSSIVAKPAPHEITGGDNKKKPKTNKRNKKAKKRCSLPWLGRFVTLPRELREQIYSHCLVDDWCLQAIVLRPAILQGIPQIVSKTSFPALAFCSRALRAEALEHFLKNNIFLFNYDEQYHLLFWCTMLSYTFEHVRHVAFCLRVKVLVLIDIACPISVIWKARNIKGQIVICKELLGGPYSLYVYDEPEMVAKAAAGRSITKSTTLNAAWVMVNGILDAHGDVEMQKCKQCQRKTIVSAAERA